MKKFLVSIILLLSATHNVFGSQTYLEELDNLKDSHSTIFNEDVPFSVRDLQRDIHNYKQLTYWQRLARFMFLGLNVVVVTPETMPKLYSFVDGLCKANNMATPAIFITINKGIFNAAAAKLFTSSGGIVLFRKIIKDATDRELEGVIAHEIGHIKYNHANKSLLIEGAAFAAIVAAVIYEFKKSHLDLNKMSPGQFINRYLCLTLGSSLITGLIINKKFEKEADAFAVDNGHGEGLIDFFQDLQEREENNDQLFDETYQLLQDSKAQLTDHDYNELTMGYYIAKGFHNLGKGFKWIYYNTPLGAHPSPEKRLELIEEKMNTLL